jgi:hypothetical protein
MEIGVGMIFKPKPIMNSEEIVKENGRAFIIIKPYGFCNEGLLLLLANIPFTHCA